MRSKLTFVTTCILFISLLFLYLGFYRFTLDMDFVVFIIEIIFSFSPLLASIWLYKAYRKVDKVEKPFWLLISIGNISNFLAEIIWDVYEIYLQVNVPYPGLPDLFYYFNYFFLLSAFTYKIIIEKKNSAIFRYMLDIAIVIAVASTFSYYFIVKPIIQSPEFTGVNLLVAIGYPIGDLLLLLLAVGFYLDGTYARVKNSQLYISLGLFVLALSDSAFLYIQSQEGYNSWGLIDLLYLLSYTLFALAGFIRLKFNRKEMLEKQSLLIVENRSLLRILLPYVYVIGLIIFMLGNTEFSVLLGTSITIVLILCRQIFAIMENKKLLSLSTEQMKKLSVNEQRYRSLFEHNTDAVFSLDLKGKFITVNNKATEFLRVSHDKLIKKSICSIFPLEARYEVLNCFLQAKKGSSSHHIITYPYSEKDVRYLSITYIPIFVSDEVEGVYGIAQDISEIKLSQERQKYLANHDPLTNLPNRRYFEKELNSAVELVAMSEKKLAVLFVDLDHFKVINDTLGHAIGDTLLREIGNRIKMHINSEDVVARQGGDEFIILIKYVSNEEEVFSKVESLIAKLNEPFFVDNRRINVTPSIGISIFPDDANTTKDLMKNADMAMYRVKRNGKNHFQSYRVSSDSKSLRELTIEKDIHTAILNNQFEVYYQPQIDTVSEKIVGVEALVRWNHPDLGIISPGEFISIAEANGVIFSLNEWVLEEACKQLKLWKGLGYDLKISVNISPQQFFQERDLIEQVKHVIRKNQLNPHDLVIEITEAIAINNMETAISKLMELKEIGVLVALDDFGTGFSSLSYLTTLPIDTIKIAKEFVDKIGYGTANDAVLASLVSLANQLNYIIVIEGVETELQMTILREMSCHIIQGFYYSKPLQVADVTLLLKQCDHAFLEESKN
ncbi:EAL domain-containing protein [Aquibacillus kalidii]|uniref:EAL domain-containing protein n=1 Tax=Aquibacillus kalidii TaxID=2762597 RepID=UPI0016488B3B|nr:EAL domain-containing protein [Aquibacillus kalidii]